MTNQAILLLGSNQGDRITIIKQAIQTIHADKACKVIAQSALYETAAWGDTTLPPHINVAITIDTAYAPLTLLKILQTIEVQFGRERTVKWGVRTLDIDIIYYNNLQYQDPQLNIPHPLMHERRFVLQPINDIAPTYLHPILQLSNRELLKSCQDTLTVVKIP